MSDILMLKLQMYGDKSILAPHNMQNNPKRLIQISVPFKW
ncbi:hypothetical protein FHS86_002787 [Roseimarinus sediminis]